MLKNFTLEEFDVIIAAGQSNCEGTGYGDVNAPYEPYQPDERVWYLTREFTIALAQETVTGNYARGDFSLNFAREYIKNGYLKEGRKILILRSAVGGTSFHQHHWGMEDPCYLSMMDMIKTALELNPKNKLVAFLWHQGETDAACWESYETHYNNLLNLLNSVKKTYNCPNIPFIAGAFVPHWMDAHMDFCKPILDAMRDLCKNVEVAEFVETEGLLSNSQKLGTTDAIHFCREALYELGERYFKAFEKIST